MNRFIFTDILLHSCTEVWISLTLFSEWSLVAKTKECGGQEISKGNKVSIDECAKACSGVASMFALGTNDFGVPRCYADGCTCLCETGAKDDGICDTVDHKGYNLYRFGTASK